MSLKGWKECKIQKVEIWAVHWLQNHVYYGILIIKSNKFIIVVCNIVRPSVTKLGRIFLGLWCGSFYCTAKITEIINSPLWVSLVTEYDFVSDIPAERFRLELCDSICSIGDQHSIFLSEKPCRKPSHRGLATATRRVTFVIEEQFITLKRSLCREWYNVYRCTNGSYVFGVYGIFVSRLI